MKPALFTSPEFGALRVFEGDGGPWIAAGDICLALGLSNASAAVASLDDDEKGITIADTLGGPQEIRIVNESGLYSLMFRSRKPEAVAFRKWVTSEVLPAIRKTGGYNLPGTYVDALKALVAAEEEKQVLALENAELRPKADFHDAVTASDDVTQLATACQVLDLPFGRNTLFQRLRNRGVLISGGDRHNLPKQRFVEQGLFTVKESSYLDEDRQVHVRFTTYVTQKGIQWLRREFQLERSLA